VSFRTRLPYRAEHPDALAVYCSDGRFTGAVAELLVKHGFDRLDTLTIPGGPALFELGSAGFTEMETVRGAARFLIEGHHIKHVTLLAHEGCGYYKRRFGFDSAEGVEARQKADLRTATAWLGAEYPRVRVVSYFARAAGGHVEFEPVE
jgi:hypothetical protein